MPEPVLHVENLVQHFSGPGPGQTIHAVNGVTFSLERGETLGLVGESGSGKSTIGRCILRLQRPTAGRIEFDGADISTLPERRVRPLRKRLQIVFQDPYSALNPRMRIGNLIGELLKLHADLTAAERHKQVLELAERVNLNADLLSRFPGELSGGQLQRVCIARALATKPSLIVLDEPTSSLDLSVRAGILDLLRELQRETGVAMLFISHDLETVQAVSHRILVLYLGSVVESGPADQVFENPVHPYTQSLLSAHLPADPNEELHRHILSGEIPSSIELPPGCHFAPRCPVSLPQCVQRAPALDALSKSRSVACFRAADGSSRIPGGRPLAASHRASTTPHP